MPDEFDIGTHNQNQEVCTPLKANAHIDDEENVYVSVYSVIHAIGFDFHTTKDL